MTHGGNCHTCKYARAVPGNCHIACANPDPSVRGDPHGVRNGWFIYPWLFDPSWMVTECRHYLPKGHEFPQTAEDAQPVVELIRTMTRVELLTYMLKTIPHVENTPYFRAIHAAITARADELTTEESDANPR